MHETIRLYELLRMRLELLGVWNQSDSEQKTLAQLTGEQ